MILPHYFFSKLQETLLWNLCKNARTKQNGLEDEEHTLEEQILQNLFTLDERKQGLYKARKECQITQIPISNSPYSIYWNK